MAGSSAGADGDPMDLLPSAILADVLGRVADARDIAACRLTSRALLAASYHCPRVRLVSGRGRRVVPFRALAANIASLLGPHLRSLALLAAAGGARSDDAWVEEEEFDEADDLHLTGGDSVAGWAAIAGGGLQEVEIADYWPQSCWRKADALPLLSHFCNNLVKLELRNAWLSVDRLKIMPNLTELTLEFIRLDDENLTKLNACFPSLQVLNLIGVGGLKEPKISLPQLKICRWEVSNIPRSLAIHAPNLVDLKLKCVRPEVLIIETPLMSTLNLTIGRLGATVEVEGLLNLNNLRIESLELNSLLPVFVDNQAISALELELPDSTQPYELPEAVKLDYLLSTFSSINEVKLGPRFSCELLRSLSLCTSSQFLSCLRKLLIHLPPSDFLMLLLPLLLRICAPSCEVVILFHADSTDATRMHAITIWTVSFPKIRWQWGTWRGSSL